MKKNKYSVIFDEIPDKKSSVAEKLIEDLIFMDSTLAALRETISEQGAVEMFEQGRQKFMRESPALKSYNATIKQRNATYTQLLSLIPKTDGKPQTDGFDEFLSERDDM